MNRGLHFIVGAAGVVAGHDLAAVGTASALLILSSICYVAWLARRGAGLVLALAAGAYKLVEKRGHMSTEDALLVAAGWPTVYVLVALAISAVEAATRPE